MNDDVDRQLRRGAPRDLAVTPERVARAVRQVRYRRRRRAALAAGSTIVAVIAVMSVTLVSPGSGDVVLQQEQPASSPSSSAHPNPTSLAARSGRSLSPVAGNQGAPSGTPVSTPTRHSDSIPTSPASPRSPRVASRGREPVTAGSVPVSNGSALCSGGQAGVGGSAAPDNWCESVQTLSNADGSHQLILDLCRPTEAGTADLHFDTVKEVDFTIRQGRRELWRWGAGQAFPASAHTVTVGTAGTCYEWQTRWNGRFDSGQSAPAGAYTLVGHSTSRELATNDQTTGFTI